MEQYRQIAHRLRIQRGPGRPDKVSERPRSGSKEKGWGDYTDSDAPTIIAFDEHDRVDIPALLAVGAIEPWTSPKPAKGKAVSADE